MNTDVFFSDAKKKVGSYEEAITLAGEPMLENKSITREYIDACVNRERDFPTGLALEDGRGVAIPHGNSKFVLKNAISIVRVPGGVSFGRMEDKKKKVPCELLFNLALTSGEQHILILRRLVSLFQDMSFIDYCLNNNAQNVQVYVQRSLEE